MAWVERARACRARAAVASRMRCGVSQAPQPGARPQPKVPHPFQLPRENWWVWLLGLLLLAGPRGVSRLADGVSPPRLVKPSTVVVSAKATVPGVVGVRYQSAQFQLQQAKLASKLIAQGGDEAEGNRPRPGAEGRHDRSARDEGHARCLERPARCGHARRRRTRRRRCGQRAASAQAHRNAAAEALATGSRHGARAVAKARRAREARHECRPAGREGQSRGVGPERRRPVAVSRRLRRCSRPDSKRRRRRFRRRSRKEPSSRKILPRIRRSRRAHRFV